MGFPTNGGRGGRSSIEACLELFGAHVAYRGVTSPAIVPAFDVLKDRLLGLFSCGVLLPVNSLGLEGAPEAFHHRVVVAVADAAHADPYIVHLQPATVVDACVLHAPVAVMDQTFVGPP